MSVSKDYLDFVLDQLEAFGPVAARRMFGGVGLYSNGLFFGLIADDVLYLKVDEANRGDYEAEGMGPFRPFGTYSMQYYEAPPGVLEDALKLKEWAVRAVDAAVRKKAETDGKKRKKKKKREGEKE